MAAKTLTKDFFIYNIINDEGTACSLIRTERELSDEELMPFRKAVTEAYGWAEDPFTISRYHDEERLEHLIDHWKNPHPALGTQDIEGIILQPFGGESRAFNGMRWKSVYGYASV